MCVIRINSRFRTNWSIRITRRVRIRIRRRMRFVLIIRIRVGSRAICITSINDDRTIRVIVRNSITMLRMWWRINRVVARIGLNKIKMCV